MQYKTIESLDLDFANLQLDILKDKYVVVKVDYEWNGVTGMHRFDICYVKKELWRHA